MGKGAGREERAASEVRIGACVRAARARRGRTLRGLAGDLGVSPATLSQLETGKARLSVTRLTRIAELLDLSVHELLAAGVDESPATDGPSSPGHDGTPAGAAARKGDWRRYPPLALDPVLRAALDAFVQKGYHGTSVRHIAQRCALSVSGIYHYHDSKQAMLQEILRLTMAELSWRARAARAEGRDPVERFSLLIENLVLFHTYRKELGFIGASEMRSLVPDSRRQITQMRNALQRMVDQEVDAAVALGRFKASRPHEAARAVVTMCTALPTWFRPDGPRTPEQIATSYVEFALDLMRNRASDTPS